ncbi:MAG: hypothetical protein AB7Q97_10020 [Gammaproteobacteria bacterium]
MAAERSYVAAAFNARPLGMPVPPNWFALAAIALLGTFVNPGFWLIGAGLEGLYLWALARNPRFRAVIDAQGLEASPWHTRYAALADRLDAGARRSQTQVEAEVAEIGALLARSGAIDAQLAGVRQMAWLHLRLLAARSAIVEVLDRGVNDRREIEAQEQRIEARLAAGNVDPELEHSLKQQRALIGDRRKAHEDAERRRELVDAELERLRQQIALVREQALLATDESSMARSLDVISTSLGEANRWLRDQRGLFADLDPLGEEPPPQEIFNRPGPSGIRARKQEGHTE